MPSLGFESTAFNGLAQNITFNLKNIKIGTSEIFGVTYNTSHQGYAPIVQSPACFTSSAGCGYDSLNVAPWWGVTDPYTAAPWNVPAIKVFANRDGKGENQSDEKSSNNKAPDNKSDIKHGIKKN